MPRLPSKPVDTPRILSTVSRITNLERLLGLLAPVPTEWLGTSKRRRTDGSGGGNLTGVCTEYRKLVQAWKKAIRWTDGLDCALSVMLASAASTKAVGEQLWVKIIGPPSCGKTTLLEGLATNTKYVLSKSTIRGFHSGWKSEGGEDTSLIALARDKTLATKDGDTLLKAPNLSQILSEARDIYDRTSRTHYRNAEEKDYSAVRMTWILCGTASLREIDESELGARFLDCVVMDSIDDDLEDEICWRAANQEDRNVCLESDNEASDHPPELLEAMRLTGGYVGYLRENVNDLLSTVDMGEGEKQRCSRLGKFVAFMRARPSKKQDETQEREFAPRLVKQHVRAAKFLAVVLNRERVDDEVMRRTTKVAFDTARGHSLTMADHLFRSAEGLDIRALAIYTGQPEDKVRSFMRFLRKIGVVDLNLTPSATGAKTAQQRWILTDSLRKLYSEVER